MTCGLLLLDGVPDHVADEQGAKGKERNSELGIVLLDNILLAVGEVAKAGKHAVPDGGSQEGIKRKGQQLHVGNACRNRNQLADNGNQAAHEGRNGAVLAEVVFGLFKLLRVEQQEVAQAAVSELVDDRTAQELGQEVVDVGAYESAHAGGKHD